MTELQELISKIEFSSRIEVKGDNYNHYCAFGLKEPQNGEIRINQKGEAFFISERTSDEPLDDFHYQKLANEFDAKRGVPLAYIKYIVQAFDSISRRLDPDHSNTEMNDLLQDIRKKISDECKEFTDYHNIGKGIVWCAAIRNYPQDYIDMVEGKVTEKKADNDEYYVNLKKGDRNPFANDGTTVIMEDKSIPVFCDDIEEAKGDEDFIVHIKPKYNFILGVVVIETNKNGALSVNHESQYLVNSKLLSFEPRYTVVRQKTSELNINFMPKH